MSATLSGMSATLCGRCYHPMHWHKCGAGADLTGGPCPCRNDGPDCVQSHDDPEPEDPIAAAAWRDARSYEQSENVVAVLLAEIARLRRIEEAARCHGGCLCEYYPGYPRGSRHAPECDNDPDLRAALEAK